MLTVYSYHITYSYEIVLAFLVPCEDINDATIPNSIGICGNGKREKIKNPSRMYPCMSCPQRIYVDLRNTVVPKTNWDTKVKRFRTDSIYFVEKNLKY